MKSKPPNPPKPPKRPRKSAANSGESYDERNERIFQSLPKLGSPEYLQRLKTATATELPGPVVVRAFRELRSLAGEDGRLSRAAEATLDWLITTEEKYGYLRPLRAKARQMVSASDWIDVNELIHEAKVEIALVLAGARGANAHQNWVSFQLQRLTGAWRRIHGRRGERERERLARLLATFQQHQDLLAVGIYTRGTPKCRSEGARRLGIGLSETRLCGRVLLVGRWRSKALSLLFQEKERAAPLVRKHTW